MPDVETELRGKSPPAGVPYFPLGLRVGLPTPDPCPGRALLSGAGQRGRQDSGERQTGFRREAARIQERGSQDSGVERSLLQLLS